MHKIPPKPKSETNIGKKTFTHQVFQPRKWKQPSHLHSCPSVPPSSQFLKNNTNYYNKIFLISMEVGDVKTRMKTIIS